MNNCIKFTVKTTIGLRANPSEIGLKPAFFPVTVP